MAVVVGTMSRCRDCGAPIRWVRTRRGRPMPIDPSPVLAGNVTVDGHGTATVHGRPLDDGTAYVAHFASCTSRARLPRLTDRDRQAAAGFFAEHRPGPD